MHTKFGVDCYCKYTFGVFKGIAIDHIYRATNYLVRSIWRRRRIIHPPGTIFKLGQRFLENSLLPSTDSFYLTYHVICIIYINYIVQLHCLSNCLSITKIWNLGYAILYYTVVKMTINKFDRTSDIIRCILYNTVTALVIFSPYGMN